MITSSKTQNLGVSWSFGAPHAPSRATLFLASRRVFTSLPLGGSAQRPAPLLSLLLPPPFPNLAARRHQPPTRTPPKLEATRAPGPVHPARSPPSPLRRVRPPVAGRAPTGERSPHRSVRFSMSLVLEVLGITRVSVLGVQKFRVGSSRWGRFLVLGNAMVSCRFGCGLLDFLDN
jgi:hypothetical protein